MRKMSFALTIDQFKAGSKTVTRRQGWATLKEGDSVMGVEKGMGLKKGQKVKDLHPIKILRVSRERIADISRSDVEYEGFPDKSPEWFVAMYCKATRTKPLDWCNRIVFEHLGGAQFERQAWARGLTPGRRVIVRTRGGQHLMSSHVIRVREFAPYDVRITVESADGTRGEFSAFDQRCTANSLGHFARTQIVPCPPELDQTAEEYRRRYLGTICFGDLCDMTIKAVFSAVRDGAGA